MKLMEEITDSGYAVARVSYQDIAPDQGDGYTNGPGVLFPGNAFDGWGKACGMGMERQPHYGLPGGFGGN